MDFTNTEDLALDVAQIWQHEQQQFAAGKSSEAFYRDLHQYVSLFFLLKKQEPFIGPEKVKQNPDLKEYYENYRRRYQQQRGWLLDYFEHDGAFYDMNVSCVIERTDVSPQHFAKLFALKLRQFEGRSEALSTFLLYHFYASFEGNKDAYTAFLLSLALHEALLAEATLQSVRLWTGMIPGLGTENPFHQPKEENIPPAAWLLSLDVGTGLEEAPPLSEDDPEVLWQGWDEEEAAQAPTEQSSAPETINEREEPANSSQRPPKAAKPFVQPGAIKNVGKWNKEEIDHFFSFLYQDRPGGEGSFLSKEEVETLLSGGITVPQQPLSQRFSLRYSERYSKNIVDYFIYQFFWHFARGKKGLKRPVLQFMGSYIEDYAGALHPEKYPIVSSNVTGEIPKELPQHGLFAIKDYLPTRYVNASAKPLR